LINLPTGHPCEDCPVRPITICRRLDAPTLASLRSLGTPQKLDPGQPIFHEGDPVRRVFMLTLGSLKIYTLLADGRRQITGFMFPGDFLGVSIDDEYAFTAEALVKSELYWFTRDAFDRFVEANPKVERELYRLAAHELAAAQSQMVLLGRKTAAERLASFFLFLAERQERIVGELDFQVLRGVAKEPGDADFGRARRAPGRGRGDPGLIRVHPRVQGRDGLR
jgi:CRP/FNR family transcriptional regulator